LTRPLAIQTEHLDAEPARWLAERCELIACGTGESRFAELLTRAHALVVRTYTRVDAALLERAPNLRVVGRGGVGLENIDLDACKARGVRVVSTPDANSQAVCEFVVALLLDAVRPRVMLDKALDDTAWKRARRELVGRREVSELTIGVYGLGRIGTRVARALSGLGAKVQYCDLREIPADERAGASPVSREELLRTSDVVTLHVDGRAGNRHLIDAGALALMKPDAILINAARGFLIDSHALADHLVGHKGASALLDVHEPEPFGPTYPLLDLPNAYLTPHLAAGTQRAQVAMSWVVRDVWRVLSGEEPHWPAV
jgi:phosphoglycerate dehydrogenase-like enzyme